MRSLTYAVVASLVATSLLQAQSHPDFSGRWTLAPDSADAATPGAGGRRSAPPTIGAGWGSDITIAQNASQLTLEYAFFTRSDMQPPHRFVFALDGSETTTRLMLGRGIEELKSRATWNGDRLKIVTTQSIPDPSGSGKPLETEVSRTLSLDSPTTLSVVTVRSALPGIPSTTTQTRYRRQ
jgi:hypothetical protein